MTPKKILPAAFENTIAELTDILSAFDNEHLNTVIYEGGWSAGQVGQHLLLSYSGAPKFLLAPVEKTDRDPAEKLETLEKIFLDPGNKLNAPDFIIPEKKDYDRDQLMTAINNVKDSILEVVRTADLTMTCTGFALPVLDTLTRMEWMYFMTVHTQRHLRQLNNIKQILSGTQGPGGKSL